MVDSTLMYEINNVNPESSPEPEVNPRRRGRPKKIKTPEEIEQDNQSHDGSGGSDTETTSQSNALEVIKVEEEYSDSLKEELLRKRPHGCIARVSTFH